MKKYRVAIFLDEEFIVDSEDEAQDIANNFQVYCEPCIEIEEMEEVEE